MGDEETKEVPTLNLDGDQSEGPVEVPSEPVKGAGLPAVPAPPTPEEVLARPHLYAEWYKRVMNG